MKQIISNYLNHRATSEELLKLQQWMAESPENRETLLRLKNNFALASYSDEIPQRKFDLMDSETDRKHFVSDKEEVRPNHPFVRLKRIFAYAAIILATLCIERLVNLGMTEWSHPAMNHLSVNEGERATVTLADGSTIWLNSNSSISYPDKFSRRKREIILRGEAFFEVSKNKKQPFIVKTASIDVKVLGTAFNVRAYEADSLVEVQVEEGKVKAFEQNQEEKAFILTANQMASFNLKTNRTVSEKFDSETGDWRQGHYLFKDKKLKEIVLQLERIYAVDIVIEEKYLGEEIYYGEINTNDPIEKILDVISLNRQFRYEKNGRKICIKPF